QKITKVKQVQTCPKPIVASPRQENFKSLTEQIRAMKFAELEMIFQEDALPIQESEASMRRISEWWKGTAVIQTAEHTVDLTAYLSLKVTGPKHVTHCSSMDVTFTVDGKPTDGALWTPVGCGEGVRQQDDSYFVSTVVFSDKELLPILSMTLIP